MLLTNPVAIYMLMITMVSGSVSVYSQIFELQRQNKEWLAINRLLRERIKELDFLQEIFNDLIKTYDLDGTIKTILDMAIKITYSEAGLVMPEIINKNPDLTRWKETH
ncbi:MAG: hypothetical protein K6T65_11800 [Peptococcaceae bacterium]|nr:hypothetical protein [Peptococcaceae bacterium]